MNVLSTKMEELNLVNSNQSDIKYKLINFPDSQPHIEFLNEPSGQEVRVMSRMSTANDLLLILFATEWLKTRRDVSSNKIRVHLYIPYLFSARMDRRMKANEPFSLKIIAQILNNAQFESITVCDAHSRGAEMLIEGLIDNGCNPLFDKVLHDINTLNYVLVQPDKGAKERTERFAKYLGYQGNIAVADKERDAQGNIVAYRMVTRDAFHGNVRAIPVVIDDIYDGGRTFELLRNELANYSNTAPYLVVTHGIFSKGIMLALNHGYRKVYTTNSFQDVRKLVDTTINDMVLQDYEKKMYKSSFEVVDLFNKFVEE